MFWEGESNVLELENERGIHCFHLLLRLRTRVFGPKEKERLLRQYVVSQHTITIGTLKVFCFGIESTDQLLQKEKGIYIYIYMKEKKKKTNDTREKSQLWDPRTRSKKYPWKEACVVVMDNNMASMSNQLMPTPSNIGTHERHFDEPPEEPHETPLHFL
jgi:hypothetical protein